jgi:hypothetical protein
VSLFVNTFVNITSENNVFAVGLGTSCGSRALIPLIAQHSEKLFSSQGAFIILGILIIFAYVALCGLADKRRDDAKNPSRAQPTALPPK